MKAVARRGRLWAPVAKSAALFVLPAPLLLAAVVDLVSGDVGRLAFSSSALACVWGAGVLSYRALMAEARYALGARPSLPAIPLKLVSAVSTAGGAGLAAVGGGHGLEAALVFGAIGAAGHMTFFGRDQRPHRVVVTAVHGVDRGAVTRQLEQAHGRLRAIEAATHAIAVPEFGQRLQRITSVGRAVLGEIERDPRDAARARRFLNLYLDSAERVTLEYVRTHRQIRSEPLEENFRRLLIEMEQTFAEQHRKLLEHDVLSLDVDIEVLNARLKNEVPGDG